MKKVFSKLKNINFSLKFNLFQYKKEIIFIFCFGIFIISNILINSLSFKIDLSKGKAYSLSSSSKKIIKNLKEKINITFYLSSELPTRLIPLKQDVIDFLNEYKKTNKEKILIKIIDPKKDVKSAQEARDNGVSELQFSQLEADKYALSTFYFGIVISANEKKEVIPQVVDSESLEYNLTSAIYKLTNKDLKKIAILGVENQFNGQNFSIDSLLKLLEKQFQVDFIEKITNQYQTLLLFDDNQKTFSQEEIDSIKKYLKDKGKIIFFVDGVWVNENLFSQVANHNLFSFFKSYGLNLNQDLVLSLNSELVNFGNNQVSFLIPYPFWIKTNNFNNKSSFFSNINQLTFPWVSSLSYEKKNNQLISDLVSSTKFSWSEKMSTGSPILLDPQSIIEPKQSDLKEKLLVANVKLKNQGEFVLIPSSRFVKEKYLGRNSDNLEFVLNLVNDYASKGVLSGIHQRAVNTYPLPVLNSVEKNIFKYLNIVFLPLIFGVFGAIRLLKRK